MAKKPIHGTVWLLVGLFATIGSLYIDRVRFMLFAFLGGIMAIVGVVKLLTQKKTPRKKTEQHPMPQTGMGLSKKCRVCNYPAEQNHRFCSQCGFPLVRFS